MERPPYEIALMHDHILRLEEELKAKEQECEELKEINSQLMKYRKHSTTCQECYLDGLEDGKLYNKELHKLKQALTEIKDVLNFYANSKIGEKQGNGTYKILLNGGCILNYDPKPARQALQKISEVIDD